MTPAVQSASQILWNFHNIAERLSKSELIVGLGSYDLRVADRCVALHRQNMAPQICFTGASGNWTSNLYSSSEAEAFAERAIMLGVPSAQITIEAKARNIGENIAFVKAKFPDLQRIIWVTKPQTQRRVRASLDVQWPEVNSIVTATGLDMGAQPTDSHSLHDLICELVGDTWRVAAYPEQGFMAEQTIPQQVQDAFETLVRAGFIDHLPGKIGTLKDR